MQANYPLETQNASKSPGKQGFPDAFQRRRVTEAEMAHAIADWFAGEPWRLEDAQRDHKGRKTVHLRSVDDQLVNKDTVIATRSPSAVLDPLPGTNLAHLSEARAVARVALRGDHVRLYGPPMTARVRAKLSN